MFSELLYFLLSQHLASFSLEWYVLAFVICDTVFTVTLCVVNFSFHNFRVQFYCYSDFHQCFVYSEGGKTNKKKTTKKQNCQSVDYLRLSSAKYVF